TGRPPFQAEKLGLLLAQVQRDQPPRPSLLRPDLPAGLEAVCLKALAKRPQDRFASMADFAAALAPFVGGRANPPRRRWWVPAAALRLVTGLGVAWYAASGKRTAPEPRPGDAPAEGEDARQKLARRLAEAHLLIDARQYDQAAAVAEQAVALDPKSP